MTKIDWPDVIPDFDVLKWKQEVQSEIYEEIKNMTTKEVLEYFHKGSEEFQKGTSKNPSSRFRNRKHLLIFQDRDHRSRL